MSRFRKQSAVKSLRMRRRQEMPRQSCCPDQNLNHRFCGGFNFGRSGGVRTRDLLPPRQTRYQAALHPEITNPF